jgi:hypothetical protein
MEGRTFYSHPLIEILSGVFLDNTDGQNLLQVAIPFKCFINSILLQGWFF